jgi:hypothetical protein
MCAKIVFCLQQWSSGKRRALKFRTPLIWREPQNHHDQCYFCVVNINEINSGNRNKWSYPNLVSVQRPISHSGETSTLSSTCFELDLMEIEDENIIDKNQDRNLDFSSSQLSELVLLWTT